MKKFSFNKIKKITFPVELPDGTELTLQEPKKADYETLGQLMTSEDMDEVYEGVALLLSSNLEGKTYKAKDVENFSMQEITAFMLAYNEFLQEIHPKN